MGEPKLSTGDGSNSGKPSKISAEILTAGDRKLLKVKLLQGETTYVSWRKLMGDAIKENGSIGSSSPEPTLNANPKVECRPEKKAPTENQMADQPHSNRFNSVIQKIESLYMGKDSSDGEELDGAPDDDEYDTEDSFIDDAELDDYFEVDNSRIKHDGFFVNRGTLERIEPSTTSNQKPKKRRRKESAKPCGDVVDVSTKQAKKAKTAGGMDQAAALGPSSKNISNDSKTLQDCDPPLKAQNGKETLVVENSKQTDKGNNQPRNATSLKSKTAGSSAPLHPKCSSKNAHQPSNSLAGKSRPNVSEKSIVVFQQESNGMHDLDKPTENNKSIPITKKGGTNVRPKSSTLEKAIRELEKVVAESRPPATTENQDADVTSQTVKRRLPSDVKLKLAKVARLGAKDGNVPEELTNRLVSIVGHLIQRRSLKRNLKIMIDSADVANREKDTRFQQIKNEVLEMLKTQIPLMESQATNQEAGSSDDFMDVNSMRKSPVKKFVMNEVLDGKVCDLYDIFVEGLDEDAGPEIRKLYANLAELWPNRLMDNHEIKRAICREKERRRASKGNLGKEVVLKDQTKTTKRKQQTQQVQKSEGTTRPDKASDVGRKASDVPSEATTSLVHSEPAADSSIDKSKQQQEKLKGTSNSSNPAVRRKSETGLEEANLPTEIHLVVDLKQQADEQAKGKAHA